METKSIIIILVCLLLVVSYNEREIETFSNWIRDTELDGTVYASGTILDGAVR